MSTAKTLAYRLLDSLGLEIDGFPNEGIAALGYWLRPRRSARGAAAGIRGAAALARCLELPGASVLDVGSGGGEQAEAFAASGRQVTCVDMGRSVYAQERRSSGAATLVTGDFNETGTTIWCGVRTPSSTRGMSGCFSAS